MSLSAAPPAGKLGSGIRALVAAIAIALVGAATVAAAVAGNGRIELALLPSLAAALAWMLWRAPLRRIVAGLVFLTLSLDSSEDSGAGRHLGLFKTPLAFLGDILRDNLERTIGLPGMKLSGLELALLLLLVLVIVRRARGEASDVGRVRTAPLLRDFVLVYLASVAFAVANGLAQGGTFLVWQVRSLVQIPALFFLFQAAFRGPADHVLLGRAVVASALVKALLSIWIGLTVTGPDGAALDFTTNHGDSILFNAGIFVLVAHLAERPDRRRLVWTLLLVPIILWGMVENQRRLAWVQLGFVLATVWALTPRARWKRSLERFAAVALPLALLYVGAGWRSSSRVFAPVGMLESLVEAKENASTYWRDVENWNIAMTMRQSPLLGRGLGREYEEVIPNDDITEVYREWRFAPHNGILGLLLFLGLFAFSGVWMLFAVTIFLAIRSYHRSRVPEDRAAALWSVCAVLVCLIQSYGDIGASFTQFRVFAALALAVTGKLAVAAGAWPSGGPAAAAEPAGARG